MSEGTFSHVEVRIDLIRADINVCIGISKACSYIARHQVTSVTLEYINLHFCIDRDTKRHEILIFIYYSWQCFNAILHRSFSETKILHLVFEVIHQSSN